MPKKVYRSTYIADNKFMVSARTRMPDEAWEYIKFFTTKDSEALFAPYEGHISVWKDNWDLPVYEHPGYKGLMKQLLLMAASTVAILPVLAVFLIFQRYFVQGLATSGLKS